MEDRRGSLNGGRKLRVKICGIRDYETARVAIDAGAWALGFIFHRASPRYVAPERVGEIVARVPSDVLTVGVFVDWPLDDLNEVVRVTGLSSVQLHGGEDLAYVRGVRVWRVIKALRVGPDFAPERVLDYPGSLVLLDAWHPELPGGTGLRADWGVAAAAARLAPLILAGGIAPENVGEAVRVVRPYGVDVSSGVESAPGVKDPELIRRLFAALGP